MDEELQKLRSFLDAALESFDVEAQREVDPVSIVWEYDDPRDREVVGLIASSLAYGRVAVLKEAIRSVLLPWGDHPGAAIAAATEDEIEDAVGEFQYRMTFREDMVDFLIGVSRTLQTHQTLEAAFVGDDHVERSGNFVQTIRSYRQRTELSRGLRYLLVDPRDGSTAKRLQLYLRWMIRGPDNVDLGVWDQNPADLIAPIDTHTARLWRYLGLSSRKSVDLKFAIAVSDRLREVRPDDPIIYDFPICHLGISQRCIHARSDEHCPGCPIEAGCSL